jgi:hypothetical protein
MGLHDSGQNLRSSISSNKIHSQVSSSKDSILCNHCKRTASNGIRCLGICVADSDY